MGKKTAKPLQRRVILVHWKDKGNSVEIFSNLKLFCNSYPFYDYHKLNVALLQGDRYFEDEFLKVELKYIVNTTKPNLPRRYFWEFDYDCIDWHHSFATIIQRILERGSEKHWEEIVRFYGLKKVISTIKTKINFLPDEVIEDACNYFNLEKKDLKCYKRKQSMPKLWL